MPVRGIYSDGSLGIQADWERGGESLKGLDRLKSHGPALSYYLGGQTSEKKAGLAKNQRRDMRGETGEERHNTWLGSQGLITDPGEKKLCGSGFRETFGRD